MTASPVFALRFRPCDERVSRIFGRSSQKMLPRRRTQVFFIRMAADKDDRQKYVFRHETIVEIQPASPWQPDIEDETSEAARRITVEKLLNRSEQFCSQTD